jgi:hypothetical protein
MPMKRTNSRTIPTRTLQSGANSGRISLLGLALLLVPVVPGCIVPAVAQQRAPVQRTVDGTVFSKSDATLSGAIVYLKDTKSMAVRTFIADSAGHFHFGQLAQNTDYELWAADSSGGRSKSKSISSFDSKNDYNFTLRIDTSK